MAKKLGSFRVLSCTLAVLATVAFIIACVDGNIEDIVQAEWDKAKDKEGGILMSVLTNLPSNSTQSSEGGEEPIVSSSSGSEGSSSPSTSPSSSREEPSSASIPTPSSSSEDAPPPPDYPYKVECKLKVTTGAQGVAIPESDWPEVKCIKKDDGSSVGNFDLKEDVKWSGDPPWSTSYWKNPPGGTYLIRVEIFDDATVVECRKLKADCGTLTITAPIPPSSTSYIYIPPSSTSYVPPPPESSSSKGSSSASGNNSACGSDGRGNMCLWNGGGACWPIKDQADRNNCGKDAWIFQGGTEGETTACSGGTFICGIDNNPPTTASTSKGCCRWNNSTQCWDVYSDQQKTDCSGGNNKYWSQACPNKEGACPP